MGVDLVVAVGEAALPLAVSAGAAGVVVLEAPDPDQAVTVVAAAVRPGDVVLIKASRAVGLDRVAAALEGAPA